MDGCEEAEFCMSQELMLLRDGMVLAQCQALGSDDESSAEIVAATADDIDSMFEIDGKSAQERTDAQRNMHFAILCKAMICSGDLDVKASAFQDIVIACEAFPTLSWPFYLQCIQKCAGWEELALQCWANSNRLDRSAMYCGILAQDIDTAGVSHHLWISFIRQALRFVLDGGCNDSATNVVGVLVDHLERKRQRIGGTSFQQTRDVIAAEFTLILGEFLTRSASLANLGPLQKCLVHFHKDLLLSLGDNDVARGGESLSAGISDCRHLIKETLLNISSGDDNDDDVAGTLNEWLGLVEKRFLSTWNEEEDLRSRDLKLLDSKNDRLSEVSFALDRLIDDLNADVVVDCLVRNAEKLQSHHVQHIFQQLHTAISTNCNKKLRDVLESLVSRSMEQWSLEDQDEFRQKCHATYGMVDNEDLISDRTQFQRNLTETLNHLTANQAISSRLSFLCLQSPTSVLKGLTRLAIESGQGSLVAQTMICLKSSCKSCDFLITHLKSRLLEDSSVTESQIQNILLFVKELVQERVLSPHELVSIFILPNLRPSKIIPIETVRRVVQLFQVVLQNSSATLEDIFTNGDVKFVTIFLRLGQLLHFCLTTKSSLPVIETLSLKRETVHLLNLLLKEEKANIVPVHQCCWLFKKITNLHPIVFCYFYPIFKKGLGNSICAEKISELSLTNLLLASAFLGSALISDGLIQEKLKTTKENYVQQGDRSILISSLAQILPKMTADEICILIRRLSSSFREQHCHSPGEDFIFAFLLVADALVLLSSAESVRGSVDPIATNCIVGMKTAMSGSLPPKEQILQLITTLCYLLSNVPCASAHHFLLDVLKRSNDREPTSEPAKKTLKRIVSVVGNAQLEQQLSQLLPVE